MTTQNAQHTPGPWMAQRHGVVVAGVERQYVNGKARDQIAMACTVQPENGGDNAQEANARLIAAAPDLLDELRKCIRLIDGEVPASAIAAIAKATGSTA